MRYTTAGESHGEKLVVIIDEVPAGFPISEELIAADLKRRRSGYGRSVRQEQEGDRFKVLSGVFEGRTTGAPIAIEIENAVVDGALRAKDGARSVPRPGHADLVGALKTDTLDCALVAERASARETAARVAAGAVARGFLAAFGVDVRSFTTRIGPCMVDREGLLESGAVGKGAVPLREDI